MKYTCEIHDRYEGVINYRVEDESEDAALEEAEIHAAEVGCRDVGEIIVFEADYLAREAFELAAYANYLRERGVRTIAGDTAVAMSPEELLWRMDDDTYGVMMFNAAWWGWQTAWGSKPI